jgi:hypothetical protein
LRIVIEEAIPMSTAIVTTVIAGVFGVVGAAVAGYYTLRAATSSKSTSEPRPLEVPFTITTADSKETGESLSLKPPESPTSQAVESNDPVDPDVTQEDNPAGLTLPVRQLREHYQYQDATRTTAQYITEASFLIREGDVFICEDGT